MRRWLGIVLTATVLALTGCGAEVPDTTDPLVPVFPVDLTSLSPSPAEPTPDIDCLSITPDSTIEWSDQVMPDSKTTLNQSEWTEIASGIGGDGLPISDEPPVAVSEGLTCFWGDPECNCDAVIVYQAGIIDPASRNTAFSLILESMWVAGSDSGIAIHEGIAPWGSWRAAHGAPGDLLIQDDAGYGTSVLISDDGHIVVATTLENVLESAEKLASKGFFST